MNRIIAKLAVLIFAASLALTGPGAAGATAAPPVSVANSATTTAGQPPIISNFPCHTSDGQMICMRHLAEPGGEDTLTQWFLDGVHQWWMDNNGGYMSACTEGQTVTVVVSNEFGQDSRTSPPCNEGPFPAADPAG